MQSTTRFLSFLTALLIASFVGWATPAQAQSRQRINPLISSFNVEASDQLAPGSELNFSLEGTPGGKASVRVGNTKKLVVLREVESGYYEGSYTVSRRDQLGPQARARATLRVRDVSVMASAPLVVGAQPADSRAAVPAAPPAPAPAPAPAQGALFIERFTAVPVPRIEPGAELRFEARGTPAARASVTIDGVVRDLPMTEVSQGRYEGAYTIRRNDNFPPSLSIVASLERNGQVARARLNQALLVDARPPTIRNLAPAENEVVAGSPVTVSATFDDSGGVGVDAKSVKIVIGGQDVTRNASITPQFFTWRGDLRPGTHRVEVLAADIAGNGVRQNWTFNVTGSQPQQPAAALPLQITSHANNAQVGSGPIEVRGRTAPDARVDVQIQAVASLAGVFGLNQQVFNQSLRADRDGNFAFTFQSQMPVPGTRYEATIAASRGDVVREARLVLFQQR